MENQFEIETGNLTFGGNCVGRLPSGKAVFIPFSLPGEKVRIQIVEEKKGYCRAKLIEILEASPRRISPRCPHYGICGGCHLQHTDYSNQLVLKQEIVADQLQRVGGLSGAAVHPVQPSPLEWNYRNILQFHQTEEGALGFQAAESHQVIPIRQCDLPEPLLNQIWPELEMEPLACVERISLRCGTEQEALLLIESRTDETPEFAEDFPLSAVFSGPGGKVVLAGSSALTVEVLGKPFQVSAGSFFQVNTAQAEAMVRHLLTSLPLEPHSVVADVYCGVGLFSAFIAPRVARLIGVEVSESACEDFAVNLDEEDHVELYQGAAEAVLPALDARVDLMIFDPPRSGLDPRVIDAAVRMKPEGIAYVSCDPATLARDASRLVRQGYQLEQVTPFDLFPQTYHIETISLFRKSN